MRCSPSIALRVLHRRIEQVFCSAPPASCLQAALRRALLSVSAPMSVRTGEPPPFHYALGQHLRALRNVGVLLLGSGNVVHNLRAYRWKEASAPPFD